MAAPHPLLPPLFGDDPPPIGAIVNLDVVRSAEEHAVAALLDEMINSKHLAVEREARTRLAKSRLWAEAQNRSAAETLEAVTTIAQRLGVEIAVFKGQAIGAAFYQAPELRPSVDVDVFVGPDDAPRIGELAVALGADPADRLAIDDMVREGRVFEAQVHLGAMEVDIHRDPMNMVLPTVDEDARWNRTIIIDTAAGPLRTLDLEDTIIQALLHLFRDNFADLLHCFDIRLMMDANPDWEEVERRTAIDGWTDIVRFAAWFVAGVFGLPSPLPTHISRWRRSVIAAGWPPSVLLQGGHSFVRSHRRQSALSLLTARSPATLAAAYRRRVVPPRSVIDARATSTSGPYPLALIRWRAHQRRQLMAGMRAEAGDEREAI